MVRFYKFLYTRDREDYGYRIRPECIPDGLIKRCRSMLDITDMDLFDTVEIEEWKNRLLVMPSKESIIVARVIKTEDFDPYMRPIVALEGTVITPGGYRGMLEIISVALYMSNRKAFYTQWKEEGNTDVNIDIPMVCNPLDVMDSDSLTKNGVSGELQKLYERLHYRTLSCEVNIIITDRQDRIASCISSFYSADVYDSSKVYSSEIYSENTKKNICTEKPAKICQILILFRENKKKELCYCWKVIDMATKQTVCRTKWLSIDKSINLSMLMMQGEKVRQHFILSGWKVLDILPNAVEGEV